jgi:hypothetical protein
VKLETCLKACTWTDLWAIGHARGLPVPRQPTKADLLALLRADLSQPGALAREVRDLPPDARSALQILALHDGWLPAGDLVRRFGPLRRFRPWRKEAPPQESPWRCPASTTEQLWYRGLLYSAPQRRSRLRPAMDGFCLPEEFCFLLLPLPAPALPVPAPAAPAEPPHLVYNLTLLHAHLCRHTPRPRQGRWLTPARFRPLLDLLWPPGCPLLAADRQAQGERSTHLLRALHFLAEAAGFLPAPPPPPRPFRLRRLPPVEEIASMAPLPPAGEGRAARSPSPERLLPTLLWDDWLARPPAIQIMLLRSLVAGRAPGQEIAWRAFQLPGWRAKGEQSLAPLRRVAETLSCCPADGTWLDLEAFLHSLPGRYLEVLPQDVSAEDNPYRQLLTGFLAWLGVVQLDGWQAPSCFRLTPLGALLVGAQGRPGAALPEPAAVPLRLAACDPDGLALEVDPAAAPALLYRLGVCPQVQWTAPGRARLTPGSLSGASAQDLGDLVHLLDAGLGEHLAGEVIALLRQWAGQGTRLTIRRVTLLEADDPGLLAHLAGQRGIRRHLRRAYGRRAVELDSNTLESLLRKLRRQGYQPDVQVPLVRQDRPAASRRWGPEDAGHLLLAARIYNRLPGRASLGPTRHLLRPTHTIADATLDRLAEGLSPRILETIEQMVEDTLQRLHDALDGWRSPPLAAEDRLAGPALAEMQATLRQALEDGHPVEIDYYTAGRGELTRRVVEPLRLEERDGVPYLVAYCRLRQAERVFRLDRIREASVFSQS